MAEQTQQPTLRLLMFAPDGYPTFRADVAALFGKYLPRHGILTDLIAPTPAETGTEVPAWGGGQTFLCPTAPGRVRTQITVSMFAVKHLLKCRKERYDGVQVRDAVLPALVGLWVARREGIPFFYWMSYPIYESRIERVKSRGLSMGLLRYTGDAIRGYFGKWLLYQWVLPASRHIFVQSRRMLEEVVAEGIPATSMTAVPMGADLEEMNVSDIAPARDVRLDGRLVMTYLGTLARVRKMDFLFEVLARVKQRLPNAVLVLAGDGNEPSDREWLERRAREIGVANEVVWTGWLPKHEGWSFVRASKVALSPIAPSFELNRGSPTKAVEYLALAVPAVCNDQPDQAQVIKESGAGLCVPYSVDAFADAILHLLANPAEAARMAARGPGYVLARRSYEIIAREVAQTYDRVMHPTVSTDTLQPSKPLASESHS